MPDVAAGFIAIMPGTGTLLDDIADKPITGARLCPDQRLALAVVADRRAGRMNPAIERRLAHQPLAPDRIHQLIPRDRPRPVLDEIEQYLADLRLEGHRHARARQLQAMGIETAIREAEKQATASLRRLSTILHEFSMPCK